MFKEFKEFALRGNVIDLAVGVIIGAAFGKIVASLVADVIMPPIGMALGGVDFRSLYIVARRADLRDARRRAEGRRADDQLRHLPEHRVRVPDHRVRRLPHRPADEPHDAAARDRAGRSAEDLPVLRVADSAGRAQVPALHVAALDMIVLGGRSDEDDVRRHDAGRRHHHGAGHGIAQTRDADREAVRLAALDYVEGVYNVQPDRIERSVHTSLVKRGFYKDTAAGPYNESPMTYNSSSASRGTGTRKASATRRSKTWPCSTCSIKRPSRRSRRVGHRLHAARKIRRPLEDHPDPLAEPSAETKRLEPSERRSADL